MSELSSQTGFCRRSAETHNRAASRVKYLCSNLEWKLSFEGFSKVCRVKDHTFLRDIEGQHSTLARNKDTATGRKDITNSQFVKHIRIGGGQVKNDHIRSTKIVLELFIDCPRR